MIIDTRSRIARYTGLNPNLDKGLQFLEKVSPDALPEGRTPIDGDRVFAIVSTYVTQESTDVPFEAHRKYIDIQCLLKGSETIFWMPIEMLKEKEKYSPDGDIVLFAGPQGNALQIDPTYFVVLFPKDAHKPGCIQGAPGAVRKLVVKAAMI
jgi:YhcH/YjgK/YiaL family protein